MNTRKDRSQLKVRCLGEFELSCGDAPLPQPATRKACSLLAYLIVRSPQAWCREQLADLLWSDRPRDRALPSLGTALWHIRRMLPPGGYLQAGVETVRFNPQSDYWLDVEEFEALCASPGDPIERLTRAVALYRGGFLEQYYDDWCLQERYRLESCYLQALERLSAAHEALGRTAEAEAECRLALHRSTELQVPWRECWACLNLAQIALLRGQYPQASRWLDQAEATMIQQPTRFQEIAPCR